MSQSDEKPKENPLEIEVELALADYMSKCDSGTAPNREEFLQQHAAMRETLSELLEAADWIEQLAGPTLADIATAPKATQVTTAQTRTTQTANAQPTAAAPPDQPTDPKIEETLPLANSPIRAFANFASSATEVTLAADQLSNRDFSLAETDTTIPENVHVGQGRILERLPGEMRSASDLSHPALPCRFGDYILERVLGRGGMGVVYLGRQINLDRPVAIKMIRSGALASQEEVQRFYAEARSAAKLDHPNIVTVYQCSEQDGHHYFSMDYVDGTDLSHLITEGPLDCKTAARYVRDVARAIQYAHDRGILHRDLKPANVLVDANQNVQVTDFGLAKFIGHETGLTATGAALGTPSYMSPEQAAGRVDEHSFATDVYSLGAILFTIVTGQPPFKAKTIVQTIMHVIHRPAPLARTLNPAVPADIETVIDRCLQKSPERRYPTAAALADDLDRFLQNKPIQARRLPVWQRAWHWALGIPIVGAVLDHRVVEPTDAHRWVQRGLISSGLLLLVAWAMLLFSSSVMYGNRLPKSLKIAAGAAGGGYERIANAICSSLGSETKCEATSLNTEGSLENIEQLLNRKVDLALLQANSVESAAIAVVSPLYYEAVHLLVRSDSPIKSISDLRGKRVVLGTAKSGGLRVAKLLLERADVPIEEVQSVSADWRQISSDATIDAAFVILQTGHSSMQKVLDGGQLRLLPISDAMEFALDEPMFHALQLNGSMYPNSSLPKEGVLTIATTAFLAARRDAPDILIEKVLACLFDPNTVKECGLLSPERAAHWQGIAWHPAAHRFFEAYRAQP